MKNVLFGFLILLCNFVVAADNNVVIVVDTSGSMDDVMRVGRSRIDVTKDVLINVLKDLPESTHIGIVSFRGWVYEFGPVDKPKLEQSIREMQAYGGTPLWEYIKEGADKLLEVRQKNSNSGVYKLIVATDGEAQDDYLAERGRKGIGYLSDIKNRGIIIDAIGVDMATDHKLATQVNGTYMRGDDPTSLKQAVQRAIAEVKFEDAKFNGDFQAIAELPEEFAAGAVSAVSTYQNQPVGEETPIAADSSGVATNHAIIAQSGGQTAAMIGVGVTLVVIAVFFLIVLAASIFKD